MSERDGSGVRPGSVRLAISNHDEQHLESFDRLDSVRNVRWKQNYLPSAHRVIVSTDADRGSALDEEQERIERRCVFAESLACVEGEGRDRARSCFEECLADD